MKKLNLVIPLLMTVSLSSQATVWLNNEQQLGKLLYQDENLSLERNQACASCHSLKPAGGKPLANLFVPGFVDPVNVLTGTPVSAGSLPGAFGGLNAPSAGYAGFSPLFYWDAQNGYTGGQFWNGRAVDLAEQAQKPFLNPLEMAMADEWAVVDRIKEQGWKYNWLFSDVYGIDLDNIPFNNGQTQIPDEVINVFQTAANAIGEFEKSRVFNKFTSKFDYVSVGKTKFTALEKQGLDLFNGKALCSGCHSSASTSNSRGEIVPPLFTDFTYDNIGLPRNFNIPNTPEPDLGLGGRSDIAADDPAGNEIGKHKVMSLRNIAITAPYGHNGVLKTLEQVVHFYNTRDVLGWVQDNTDANFGKTGWPEPEIPQNVNNIEMGNLGLTSQEEKALVAFLKTLTDDYQIWGLDFRVPIWSPAPFNVTP